MIAEVSKSGYNLVVIFAVGRTEKERFYACYLFYLLLTGDNIALYVLDGELGHVLVLV